MQSILHVIVLTGPPHKVGGPLLHITPVHDLGFIRGFLEPADESNSHSTGPRIYFGIT